MTLTNISKSFLTVLFMCVMAIASFTAVDVAVFDHTAVDAATNIIPENPIKPTDPGGEAGKLIQKIFAVAKIFAGFVLAVSVIVIVYGGMKYVMSQGDARAAEQGKMLIIYAGIGIFIALSAFIIVKMFTGFAA